MMVEPSVGEQTARAAVKKSRVLDINHALYDFARVLYVWRHSMSKIVLANDIFYYFLQISFNTKHPFCYL